MNILKSMAVVLTLMILSGCAPIPPLAASWYLIEYVPEPPDSKASTSTSDDRSKSTDKSNAKEDVLPGLYLTLVNHSKSSIAISAIVLNPSDGDLQTGWRVGGFDVPGATGPTPNSVPLASGQVLVRHDKEFLKTQRGNFAWNECQVPVTVVVFWRKLVETRSLVEKWVDKLSANAVDRYDDQETQRTDLRASGSLPSSLPLRWLTCGKHEPPPQ